MRVGFRFTCVAVLAAVSAPLAYAFHDWARAVRTARNTAATYAWNKAEQDFLGVKWPIPPRPNARITSVASPPEAGPFSGYEHAVRVGVTLQWLPAFHAIVGGPYPIEVEATAAIMRNKEGRWMPIMVE